MWGLVHALPSTSPLPLFTNNGSFPWTHREVSSEPPLKAFIIRFLFIYHLPFLKYKFLFFIFEVINVSNIHLVFYLVGKFNIGIWVFSLWLLLDIVPWYIYGIIIHYNYFLNISNIFSDSILFWNMVSGFPLFVISKKFLFD